MKNVMRAVKTRCTFILMLALMCLLVPAKASAETLVPASGDESGSRDYSNIMDALKEDGDVVLESGATYYLKTTLWLKSNQKLTATGATIITKGGAFRNKPTQTNYKSIENCVIDGGVWKNEAKEGCLKTMVQFSHCSNITLKNLTVYCNYEGHAVELIACKNVTVDNCELIGVGKWKKNSVEEQLQIDIATPKTAPTVGYYGKEFVKGQTCENITVTNCKITGARGLCANYAASEKKYQTKFHKNIVIKNNKITGTCSEGVALFNVIGAKVENNTIISKSGRTGTAYSVGCHIAMFGNAPASINKASYTIKGNTIKGGRQGFYVYSHSSSKFGKVTVSKNKCYAKAGENMAILVDHNSAGTIKISNNKTSKWK